MVKDEWVSFMARDVLIELVERDNGEKGRTCQDAILFERRLLKLLEATYKGRPTGINGVARHIQKIFFQEARAHYPTQKIWRDAFRRAIEGLRARVNPKLQQQKHHRYVPYRTLRRG